MDGDRRRAGSLRDPGDFGGVDGIRVKARANLHRERLFQAACYGVNDFPGELRIPHERRALAIVHDLRHGAAHVNVNKIKMILDSRCLFCHDLRLGAEKLRADRPLPVGYLQQTISVAVSVGHRLGADHFRDHHVNALLFAELPEGAVRDARHRGKEDRRAVPLHLTDLYHPSSSGDFPSTSTL